MRKTKPTDFSMALADYLFVFLPTQKGLSENTIRSYSDTLELFLRFIENERGIKRERLEIAHISRPVVEDFLAWLETDLPFPVPPVGTLAPLAWKSWRYFAQGELQ